MDVTIGGTLFLLDLDTFRVTICTWEGGEASMSVAHLCAFVDHLREKNLRLPPSPPVAVADPEGS